MKRVIIIIVIIVVALGAIAYVLSNNKKKNEAKTAFIAEGGGAVAVRIANVDKKVVDLDFAANGNFVPKQELNFLSENAGRVSKIYVDEGDRVTKGQILARVDAEIINTDKETAEANYQNALRDEARYKSSYETGGVTQQQLDQAKLTTQNAKLRLQASQRKVSDANLKSPINGIINKRYIEVGAFVNTQGTQLFEIVDVSKLKLRVNVNESQVANLKIGDKIDIKSSVFPTEKFNGKVTFIAAKADATLNFPIEIEVDNNTKNSLKAGMYGTAVFNFPKQAPSILIPRTSFVGSVSSNQVFMLDKSNNTSKIRKVVAGRILGDFVEILDGLNEGETVITSGQINLAEGTPVSIVK
ncbi:efflux RND transporter periplasmic adaptor subunit [Pedobacter panaciterrae]|jgi:RND family efflux transporter MFP subunit|uniref:Efflux RND transporter periplasmic adaptor subunit n=1 Tax=Pedobacter panaciterrae TaxID=363849 RepID=A0ABU8NUU4_9SPHI|nr:efflux RND transporter periplasmic adaptor subunit [Pedobacter panaciterrae]NQX53529.1 efflux RND transporter periplasmic adaptor subunit [Pedobacter panaciterrae]